MASRSLLPRLAFAAPSIYLSSSSIPRRLQSPAFYPSFRSPIHVFRCSISSETKVIEPAVPSVDSSSKKDWKIKMLYDGDCPLCMREVNMLKERNKQYGSINFVDISSKDYKPEENQGLDYKTVMGRIHAIQDDGTVFTDVEAFRRLYEEVGLGWIYAVTKYEPIKAMANAIYSIWAKYRLQLTGRPSLDDIIASRKESNQACDSKSCRM